MSLIKSTGFLLLWLAALLCGAAGLGFFAVWGLDTAGLSPVWGVPVTGIVLLAAGLGLWLRLALAAPSLTPQVTWRESLRYRAGQVAGGWQRVRSAWQTPSFGWRTQRRQPSTAPHSVATNVTTPVHSVVIFTKLPPLGVAPAVSAKEKARHATK